MVGAQVRSKPSSSREHFPTWPFLPFVNCNAYRSLGAQDVLFLEAPLRDAPSSACTDGSRGTWLLPGHSVFNLMCSSGILLPPSLSSSFLSISLRAPFFSGYGSHLCTPGCSHLVLPGRGHQGCPRERSSLRTYRSLSWNKASL